MIRTYKDIPWRIQLKENNGDWFYVKYGKEDSRELKENYRFNKHKINQLMYSCSKRFLKIFLSG